MNVFRLIPFFALLLLASCQNTKNSSSASARQIKADLNYLDNYIAEHSSYAGLNGFDYQKAFSQFLQEHEGQTVTQEEFGLFLTTTIGKMGDRHANVRGYRFPSNLCFPTAFAPYGDAVVYLNSITTTQQYEFAHPAFPVVKAIDNMPINELLAKATPEDFSAPKTAYLTKAVRELRDIDELYAQWGKTLPNPILMTLSNLEKTKDTTIQVELVDRSQRRWKWDEQFYRQFFMLDDEDYNKDSIIQQLFSIDEGIGYVRIPSMVEQDEAPQLYARFNQFMHEIEPESKALIIDVRSNGGGVRDLIYEMAGYFVHPDSVYVVNVAQQRGEQPLNEDLKDDLHHRYLYAKDELDEREKEAVQTFLTTFTPMYDLDPTKFSPFHYMLFNGQKLAQGKFHYNKPVYILCNERTFSAASVLVAVFKGLPNITIAGVNTDGSSGNSERFRLPKTQLRGKISTMVSFQKDGKTLDGYGTAPDLELKRDVDQILWKRDAQLEDLKALIKGDKGEN
ncbi:MAG: peptidase S41 [Crocinitomicaceae bacterium]|nr:peptidase S41 [Crocinitomicaceae bacterium]|tara:strand:- start:3505 stop:5025 length:1521 start_codon:yes stop_codon:yes gene_type:complete